MQKKNHTNAKKITLREATPMEKRGILMQLLPTLKRVTRMQAKKIEKHQIYAAFLLGGLFLVCVLCRTPTTIYYVISIIWAVVMFLPICHKICKNLKATYICEEVSAERFLVSDEVEIPNGNQNSHIALEKVSGITVFVFKRNEPIPVCAFFRYQNDQK